jgi:hypothetical protein
MTGVVVVVASATVGAQMSVAMTIPRGQNLRLSACCAYDLARLYSSDRSRRSVTVVATGCP